MDDNTVPQGSDFGMSPELGGWYPHLPNVIAVGDPITGVLSIERQIFLICPETYSVDRFSVPLILAKWTTYVDL